MGFPPRPRSVLAAILALSMVSEGLAQLECRPTAIDFGDRGQNERPEATLTLRNAGTKPILVRDLKKSCDCIAFSPPQLPGPIPPGESVQVTVSMGSGRAMGRLDKWITLVTDDPSKPESRISVAMKVLDDFVMEPREVRFEGVVGGETQRAEVDIKVRPGRSQVPVRVEVKGIHGRFQRTSEKFLRALVSPIPGGERIALELNPGHPEGLISAELEASLNGKALFIPVSGDMFAWIKVSPNYVNFSRALESDPASTVREVVLTSTDGTPFRILEIGAQPTRAGEKSVKLEWTVTPGPEAREERIPGGSAPAGGGAGSAAPGGGQPPASRGTESLEKAPGRASTVQKIVFKAHRGEGKEAVFFGNLTIRTDNPHKPSISLKYSGFFANPPKK